MNKQPTINLLPPNSALIITLIILKHGGDSILLTIIHGLLVASLTNLLFTFFCYVTNFW